MVRPRKGGGFVNNSLHSFRSALVLGGVTLLAVLVYNTWSYCCGHCAAQTLFNLWPVGTILLGANILAAATLLWLRRRRRMRSASRLCRCGADLLEGWGFCPDCGRRLPSILSE